MGAFNMVLKPSASLNGRRNSRDNDPIPWGMAVPVGDFQDGNNELYRKAI